MAVSDHDAEREVVGVEDQRGPDQVAVDGVAAGPAARLHLQENPELFVDGVNLVADPRCTLLTEEDGERDPLVFELAFLNPVSNAFELRTQLGQNPVAGKAGDRFRVDLPLGLRNSCDDLGAGGFSREG